jgi:flavodoxin
MASAVVDGVREGGAEAELFTASEFDASMLSSFDAVAFGCPSMGSEQLEDSEFEPMFNSCEGDLGGKKIALFGSDVLCFSAGEDEAFGALRTG